LDERAENTIRAELEEAPHALSPQPPNPVKETHRFTHMRDPILRRAEPLDRDRPTTHVGDHRNPRLSERQTPRHLGELVEHPVHPRRVKSMRDTQTLGLTPSLSPQARQLQHGVLIT